MKRPLAAVALLALLAILTVSIAAAQSAGYSRIYNFKGGADGSQPKGTLIRNTNGNLFGTTYGGGTGAAGTVFELVSGEGDAWTKTILHSFGNSPDGAGPYAGLTFGNGVLFGSTLTGGIGGGTVFEVVPPASPDGAWSESVLYALPGGCSVRNVYGGVTLTPSGSLLGTAEWDACEGGALRIGVGGSLFLLEPPSESGGSWKPNVVVDMNQVSIGTAPQAAVVGSGGSFYGTDASNCGTAYEATPVNGAVGWAATSIHDFVGWPTDGCSPRGPVIAARDGVLYGTTQGGGSASHCALYSSGGCGTVFQLTPPTTPGGPWLETVIYSFTGENGDGAYPDAGLTLGENGVLYGTTAYGGVASASACAYYGSTGCGSVFQLTPPTTPGGAWTETILHGFTGEDGDGSVPYGGLVLSPNGVLYGTTSLGGTANKGTVFSVTP